MEISTWAVVAQIINFLILFFLFKKFLTKPIATIIEDRRNLIKKLENADKVYEEKLEDARLQAKDIINEWMDRKEKLILEAWVLADKKRDEILADAKVQSEKLVHSAAEKAKILETELENNFINWVKRTSLLVVKKLVNTNKDIKDSYLDEAMREVIKN